MRGRGVGENPNAKPEGFTPDDFGKEDARASCSGVGGGAEDAGARHNERDVGNVANRGRD